MLEFVRKFYEGSRHYLGLVNQVKSVVSGMINMLGDASYNYPIDRMVKMQGNKEHSWCVCISTTTGTTTASPTLDFIQLPDPV